MLPIFWGNLGVGERRRGKMSTIFSRATQTSEQREQRYSLPAAGILVSWGSFFFQFRFLAFTGSVFILVLSKANEKNIQQRSTFTHHWEWIFHTESHRSAGVSQSLQTPKPSLQILTRPWYWSKMKIPVWLLNYNLIKAATAKLFISAQINYSHEISGKSAKGFGKIRRQIWCCGV